MANKLADATMAAQIKSQIAPEASKGMPPPGPADPPQPQVTVQQVKDAIRKQAKIDNKMRGLLRSGKPVERKAAIDMCIGLVAEGVFSAEQMAGYMMTLPNDAMKVREWLEQHAKTVEGNLDHMVQMIHGQEATGETPMPGAPEPAMPGAPQAPAMPMPMDGAPPKAMMN